MLSVGPLCGPSSANLAVCIILSTYLYNSLMTWKLMLTLMAHFRNLSPLITVLNKVIFLLLPFFTMYFAITLTYAFQDCEIGIYVWFRTTSKVFDLTRFNANLKNFQILIWELPYVDDADLISHTREDMQAIMDHFSIAYTIFVLTINLKMKSMFTPFPG